MKKPGKKPLIKGPSSLPGSDKLHKNRTENVYNSNDKKKKNSEDSISLKFLRELEVQNQELLKFRESYINLFHSVTEAIYVQDENGVFIDVNSGAEKMYGYSQEEIIGKTPEFLSAPGKNDLTYIKTLLDKAYSTGEPQYFEFWGRKKNGEIFPKDVISKKVRFFNRDVLITTARDISERKNAEDSIIRQNTRLQVLSRGAQSINEKLEITAILQRLVSLAIDITGSTSGAAGLYSDGKMVFTEYNQDGKVFPIDLEFKKDYGVPGWIIANKRTYISNDAMHDAHVIPDIQLMLGFYNLIDTPILSSNGDLLGCFEIHNTANKRDYNEIDIDILNMLASYASVSIENAKFFKALHESEEKHRILLEESTDPIFSFTSEGIYSFVNKAFAHGVGKEKEQIVGKSIWDVFPKEEAEKRFASLNQVFQSGEEKVIEARVPRKEGDHYYITTITPIKDKTGKPVSVICSSKDITERKIAERELIKAKEKAEESDRLKTAFLHNISHEIRTPMNAIVGFSELLRQTDLNEEYKQSYLDILSQSSHHLLSILSDIIEISNIEAGIIKLTEKETNLNVLLRNLHAQFHPKAEEKNILLQIEIGLTDNDSWIHTDPTKLFQIFTNLLGNALKFTHHGRVTIGYNLKNNFLEFYVSDTGIGIDENHQKKIFDRFYRVEHTGEKLFEGTGLGLAISRAYTELLGGKIWLSSTPEKGSTFIFTIPYTKGSKPSGNLSDNKSQENSFAKEKTVLIAEDEDYNFQLMTRQLSNLNLKFLHAKNGKEAVDIYCSNQNIDLVIMDIKMPVMDGCEATTLIKKHNPAVPVIALTPYAFENDREIALKSGCNDFISKPVNRDFLVSMVKKSILK